MPLSAMLFSFSGRLNRARFWLANIVSSRSFVPMGHRSRFSRSEFSGMQLDEVVHARRLLTRELEQIVGHAIVATPLVEFGHHREVRDDVRWYACRQKLLVPRRHRHLAIADLRPSASEKTPV